MDDLSIIRNIKFYREQAGKKQHEMAALLGIHRATYNAIEKGKKPLIKTIIFKIAEILGIPPEQLILGEDYVRLSKTVLEEKDNLKEQLAVQAKYYEEQIKALMKENEYLRQINDSQAATIKRNNEMIEMLRRQK